VHRLVAAGSPVPQIIFGLVNHLGAEPDTQAYQPEPALCGRLEWVPGESWESKQAHRVIHQPVSVVLQCGAGAWLHGLASGDQCQLMGSGSELEACSRYTDPPLLYYFTLLTCKVNVIKCRQYKHYKIPFSECLKPDDEWTKTNFDRLSSKTFWSNLTACCIM